MNDGDGFQMTIQEHGKSAASFEGGSTSPAGPSRPPSRADMIARIMRTIATLPPDSPVLPQVADLLGRRHT
jgi:hypothetical protein